MSPNLRRVQSDAARRHMAERRMMFEGLGCQPGVHWRALFKTGGTVLAVGLCMAFLWALLIAGGA